MSVKQRWYQGQAPAETCGSFLPPSWFLLVADCAGCGHFTPVSSPASPGVFFCGGYLNSLFVFLNYVFTCLAAHLSCGASFSAAWRLPAVVCRLSCPLACGLLVSQTSIKPASPALGGGFYPLDHQGKPQIPHLGALRGQQPHCTRGSLDSSELMWARHHPNTTLATTPLPNQVTFWGTEGASHTKTSNFFFSQTQFNLKHQFQISFACMSTKWSHYFKHFLCSNG